LDAPWFLGLQPDGALSLEFTVREIQKQKLAAIPRSLEAKNGLDIGKLVIAKNSYLPTKAVRVKYSKSAIHREFHSLPALAFEGTVIWCCAV